MKRKIFINPVVSLTMSCGIFLGSISMSFAQQPSDKINLANINNITNELSTSYKDKISLESAINETGKYIYNKNQNPSLYSEWNILGLSRGNCEIPKEYYDKYYNNVVDEVKKLNGVLSDSRYTEYSRVILGLSSIGKDATNVGGYNIINYLGDFDKVIEQGINGPIFALLALNSNKYEIKGMDTERIKNNYLNYILNNEIEGGGWALWGNKADPDITAMALQAISKYKEDENVSACINRAIDALSKAQNKNGGYDSWGTMNSESIAQVIVALTELGIDPAKDSRFIKESGKTPISAIMEFYVEGGGFRHTLDTAVNGMATEQSMYALVSYDRFLNNKNTLYDMTDAF